MPWPATASNESVCVFDLEIVGFERNLWIDTALAGTAIDRALSDYLAKQLKRA